MDIGYGVDPLRERPVVSGLPAESATRERYADENRRKDEVVSKQLVNFAKRKQIYKKNEAVGLVSLIFSCDLVEKKRFELSTPTLRT